MSLSYSTTSIVGGPLSSGSNNLLQQRQRILEKTEGLTNKELSYLNANTAWIKLTSSVNVDQSSDLAKKYVLLGGTLYENALRGGLTPDSEDGRGAYEESEVYGYVPMPGILGFTVRAENTFGTLRAATVEFKANSIEQLSDLESLFLRPGYSILLEWGHGMYLERTSEDSEYQIVNNIRTLGDKFFEMTTQKEIVTKINELREKTTNNYEAMFGVVKNFTWAYAQNGEYDCKVDIVSKGDLLESLRIDISTDGVDKDIPDSNSSPYQYSSDLKHFFSNLINTKNEEDLKDTYVVKRIKKGLEDKDLELKYFKVDAQNIADEETDFFTYIPLYVFLEALNQCNMLKSGKDFINSFYIGENDSDGLRCPFVTFKQHFIIDPYIGFLPKGQIDTKFGYDYALKGKDLGDTASIHNICVNVSLLSQALDKRLGTAIRSEQNVLDYVKDILREIQFSSGNINEFDIYYEDEEFKFFIVDRQISPDRKDLPVINVQGLGATIQDLSLTSALTSKITSMVAIAAQASKTDAIQDLLNMNDWNKGLVDRYNPDKYYDDNQKEEIKLFRILSVLEKTYDREKEKIFYTPEDFDGINSVFSKLMNEFISFYSSNESKSPPGILPMELNLQLTGLGGLRIGQAFTIPTDLIPIRYRDPQDQSLSRVGWVITNLEHSIDNNRWVTDIGTIMCIIEPHQSELQVSEDLIEETLEQLSDFAYDAEEIPEEEKLPLEFPLPSREIRNDAAGGGHFVSPRDGGRRKHRGTDFVAEPGTPVKAPFDGVITAGITNSGLPKITLKGIKDYKDYTMVLNYAKSTWGKFRAADKGEVIGVMSNLALGYKDAETGVMKNHLDIKFDYKNKRVDPEIELA